MQLKISFCCLAALLLAGCATQPAAPHSVKKKARVTYYHVGEDKWGSRIATGGRAKQGVTIAAERAFPFGTAIRIPELRGLVGDGNFVVQDRGRYVQSRKASRGECPVFDVFVSSKLYAMLVKLPPMITEYEETN